MTVLSEVGVFITTTNSTKVRKTTMTNYYHVIFKIPDLTDTIKIASALIELSM